MTSDVTSIFENGPYQDLIDKINKIRSYGLNKMITIPQIAILGDQSSGKSSVLEAITKLTFPRNIETCTRFATQVNMRRSERDEISAHIDGETDFNVIHKSQTATLDIHNMIDKANSILCSSVEISEKVLEITISGPTLSPLTIIDLPGYINTTVDGQDKSIVQKIREINTRYIKDSRTIILAVVPANVDLNNIFVLGEAENYDKSNERTIPIVTKPDTIEQDLLPSLVNTLLNRRKYMKLGYLVLKNSSYKDIDLPWEDARQREADFFKSSPLWNQVPESRKGRVSVKRFLGELLYTHIRKELPFLKKDIIALISECEKDITSMGPPVSDTSIAKIKYIDCIMKLKTSLTALLDGHYAFEYINQHKSEAGDQTTANDEGRNAEDGDNDEPLILKGDHRFIRSSLQRLYERYNQVMARDKHMLPKDKISKLVLRYKGNELPGFVSFATFTQIYMETLASWHDITKAHVSNIQLYLYEAITSFIAFAVDPLLKDTFTLEFDRFYGLQTAKIDDALDNIFADEDIPFTMNKYYYDNILNSRKAKVEQQIQGLLNKYRATTNVLPAAPFQVEESDVNYNEQLAAEDLQDELQSYCKVARKRIVDVVLLQSIERYMIKQINLYFEMLVVVDENSFTSKFSMTTPSDLAYHVKKRVGFFTDFWKVTAEVVRGHFDLYPAKYEYQDHHDSAKLLADVPSSRRAHRITAAIINDISFTRRSLKKREMRLRRPENKPVKEVLEALSKAALGASDTVDAVDKAATVQREVRHTLQEFVGARARIKYQRTRRIRSKRVWAIKAAEERRFLCDHAGREPKGQELDEHGWCVTCNRHPTSYDPSKPFQYPKHCTKEQDRVLPILAIGAA
ncbi:hypothetical protein BGZ72_009517, partial [Mortierella alpina]